MEPPVGQGEVQEYGGVADIRRRVGQRPLGGQDETRDAFAGFGTIDVIGNLDKTTLHRSMGQRPC